MTELERLIERGRAQDQAIDAIERECTPGTAEHERRVYGRLPVPKWVGRELERLRVADRMEVIRTAPPEWTSSGRSWNLIGFLPSRNGLPAVLRIPDEVFRNGRNAVLQAIDWGIGELGKE